MKIRPQTRSPSNPAGSESSPIRIPILGIGNGERANTEPYGVAFRKRVARLEEALAILRRLWESPGEPVDFDGSFWRLRRARFATPLYGGKPPPVWLAANAPRMLALTGRYADGWLRNVKMAPEIYGEKLERIRAAAAAAGRSLARFEPAMFAPLVLGHDRSSALADLARSSYLAAMLALLLPGGVWRKHGLQHPLGETSEGLADVLPEEVSAEQIEAARRQLTPDLLGELVFAGSAAEVGAEIAAFVPAGLRHVVIADFTAAANGSVAAGVLQLALIIRRLRRIPLRAN